MDYLVNAGPDKLLIFITAASALLGALGIAMLLRHLCRMANTASVQRQSFQLSVISQQGTTNTLAVGGGQTLLSALASTDYSRPSGCGGGGTCCQCMIKGPRIRAPISGQEQLSLTANEINRGYRLACQVEVNDNMTIEVPAAVLEQREFEVVSNDFLTPVIKELVLRVPPGSNFNFRAGQFVNFQIPPFSTTLNQVAVPVQYSETWRQQRLEQYHIANQQRIERSYSLASSPSTTNQLVFNIALALPKFGHGPGIGSSYLFGLKSTDRVQLSGPLGDFVTDPASCREIVFVGTGAGMAPLKSHIDGLISSQSRRKISLWFGARSEHDIFYQQHFDRIARRHHNFSWTLSLSKPQSDNWQGATGHIQRHLFDNYLDNHRDVSSCDFMLCGSRLMLKDVTRLLNRRGVKDSQILCDDFAG